MKFAEKIKLNQWNNLIMIYNGNHAGQDFFAYIKCTEQAVEQMHKDYEEGAQRNITEYGEVIYLDNIAEPDDKALEFLRNYLAENGGELM